MGDALQRDIHRRPNERLGAEGAIVDGDELERARWRELRPARAEQDQLLAGVVVDELTLGGGESVGPVGERRALHRLLAVDVVPIQVHELGGRNGVPVHARREEEKRGRRRPNTQRRAHRTPPVFSRLARMFESTTLGRWALFNDRGALLVGLPGGGFQKGYTSPSSAGGCPSSWQRPVVDCPQRRGRRLPRACGGTGRHVGLRSRCPKGMRVRVPPGPPRRSRSHSHLPRSPTRGPYGPQLGAVLGGGARVRLNEAAGEGRARPPPSPRSLVRSRDRGRNRLQGGEGAPSTPRAHPSRAGRFAPRRPLLPAPPRQSTTRPRAPPLATPRRAPPPLASPCATARAVMSALC